VPDGGKEFNSTCSGSSHMSGALPTNPVPHCLAAAVLSAHLRLQRTHEALPEATAQIQQRLLAALRLQPPHHLRAPVGRQLVSLCNSRLLGAA